MKRDTRRTIGREENTTLPPRRRGGQELPDSVQDRPEQNAGYDAAVHGGDAGASEEELFTDNTGDAIEEVPPAPGSTRLSEIDDAAARDAAAEVRRRERRR
jgi:hypothetical protein